MSRFDGLTTSRSIYVLSRFRSLVRRSNNLFVYTETGDISLRRAFDASRRVARRGLYYLFTRLSLSRETRYAPISGQLSILLPSPQI